MSCLSFRREEQNSHPTDFRGIHMYSLNKICWNVPVSVQSAQNNDTVHILRINCLVFKELQVLTLTWLIGFGVSRSCTNAMRPLNLVFGALKSNYWLRRVCLSVCPHGTTRLPLDRYVEKIQVSLKYDKNNGYFMGRHVHIYISFNSS